MLLKVVFDTNIFISAVIFGGNPRMCLTLAREGKIALFVSKELLLEIAEKLHNKFIWSDKDIKDVIIGICKFAQIVEPKAKINKIKKDPSDNLVLEIAQEVNANYIISGDKKHILPLKKFEGTKIITAADFLLLISQEARLPIVLDCQT